MFQIEIEIIAFLNTTESKRFFSMEVPEGQNKAVVLVRLMADIFHSPVAWYRIRSRIMHDIIFRLVHFHRSLKLCIFLEFDDVSQADSCGSI